MARTGPRPATVPLHHSLYTYCLEPSGDWPVAWTNAQRIGLAGSVNSVRSSAQSLLPAACASAGAHTGIPVHCAASVTMRWGADHADAVPAAGPPLPTQVRTRHQ